jgi:myxalamid-type polyketide synthase MxaB
VSKTTYITDSSGSLPNDNSQDDELRWQKKKWSEDTLLSWGQNVPSQNWLIFADRAGCAGQLAQKLRDRNQKVILVYPGPEDSKLGLEDFQIRPDRKESLEQFLNERENTRFHKVIHLWSLDETFSEEMTLKALEWDQRLGYGSILNLIQILTKNQSEDFFQMFLATKGTQRVTSSDSFLAVSQSPIWGLARVIRLEHPNLKCTCIDLEKELDDLCLDLFSSDCEDQIAYRGGLRYVARLVQKSPEDSQFRLQSFESGFSGADSLDQLELFQKPPQKPGFGEIEISVKARSSGGECSGEVIAIGQGVHDFKLGDRVVTLAGQCVSSFIMVAAEFAELIPQEMSFAEAAHLPIAFLTAHYALNRIGRMKSGDRLLIHTGVSEAGMAAIQLASLAGAEIFVAVSAPEENISTKELGVTYLFNSPSSGFVDEVLKLTNGEGVDLILNSLAGEFIPKSLSVLKEGGRFLEIGKAEIWTQEQIDRVKMGISYFVIALDQLNLDQPEFVRSMFSHLMAEFRQKRLKPLLSTSDSIEELEAAFRCMAQGKNTGKIAITQGEQKKPKSPQGIIRREGSYLITGGMGSLGILVAQGLVETGGATCLILVGSTNASPEARETILRLESQGAKILIRTMHIARECQLADLLADLETNPEIPPLRGVVHAAGVRDDGFLTQQTWEKYVRVMSPKVIGAWNLHRLTQRLKEPLDFFICFSSAAAVLGKAGQGNFAAANAFLDSLMHLRRQQGLVGLSINWDPWAEGLESTSPQQGLDICSDLLGEESAQVGVFPIQWPQF